MTAPLRFARGKFAGGFSLGSRAWARAPARASAWREPAARARFRAAEPESGRGRSWREEKRARRGARAGAGAPQHRARTARPPARPEPPRPSFPRAPRSPRRERARARRAPRRPPASAAKRSGRSLFRRGTGASLAGDERDRGGSGCTDAASAMSATINLCSADGQMFEVDEAVAFESQMIKNMIEGASVVAAPLRPRAPSTGAWRRPARRRPRPRAARGAARNAGAASYACPTARRTPGEHAPRARRGASRSPPGARARIFA